MDQPVRKSRIRQPLGEGTPSCLYPDEAEIARLILGPKRVTWWKGLVVVLERGGFPRIDPEFGGRYWPAVQAFLDRRNHIADYDEPVRSKR
jgi:hypothetical protein